MSLPDFYLFYNGLSSFPEKTTLYLSHCFEEDKEKPCLELEVKAYNINVGYNKRLMEKSQDLREYARFVEVVREKLIIEKRIAARMPHPAPRQDVAIESGRQGRGISACHKGMYRA